MKLEAVFMSESAKLYKPKQQIQKLRKLSRIDILCILCTEIYLLPWGNMEVYINKIHSNDFNTNRSHHHHNTSIIMKED